MTDFSRRGNTDFGFFTDPFDLGLGGWDMDPFDFGTFGYPFDFGTFGYPFDTFRPYGYTGMGNTDTDTTNGIGYGRGGYGRNAYGYGGRGYDRGRRRNPNRRGGGRRSFATRDDRKSDWLPDWDVMNGKEEVVVVMEVPGISKDRIKVEVEEGRLVISGERPMDEKMEKAESIRIREREFGSFKRRVRLPEGCDISKISAKCDNGILEVHVPKSTVESGVRVNIQ